VTITRKGSGRGFVYHLDRVKLPSVTQVTGMLPSKNLIDWAANATADYAVDHLRELVEMPPSAALNTLKRARYEITDPAKRRGTEVHKIAEPAIAGEPVDMDAVPPELRGYVESYMDFLDVVDPQPVATELVVASRKHRYAGRLDLIADLPEVVCDGEPIPAGRWLLDLKTGEKGIYPETALQTCGYEHCDLFAPNDGQEPDERPMSWLQVERCGAVLLRSDSWELHPLDTGDDTWMCFRYLLWMLKRQESMREWVRSPARPIASAELADAAP
jgi:hypothetical protein